MKRIMINQKKRKLLKEISKKIIRNQKLSKMTGRGNS